MDAVSFRCTSQCQKQYRRSVFVSFFCSRFGSTSEVLVALWTGFIIPGKATTMAAFQNPNQVYDWVDPTTQTVVKFHAKLIIPPGSELKEKVPVAVYFHGMGEKANAVMGMGPQWQKVAPEPFVLLAPQKQKHGWWFLNSESAHAWVDGAMNEELVKVYCRWLKSVTEMPLTDADRIGLFGWSGGAYAITEILANGDDCIPLSGVALGAVHGHGQRDVTNLPVHLKPLAIPRFDAFLERLKGHNGVQFLEATHATEDKESNFEEALEIIQALSERNAEFGFEGVGLRELGTAQQDVKPKKNKNRTHHNYFNASFLRKDMLVALFGGESPPPFEKKDIEDDDGQWQSEASQSQASSAQDTIAEMQAAWAMNKASSLNTAYRKRADAAASANGAKPSVLGSGQDAAWDADWGSDYMSGMAGMWGGGAMQVMNAMWAMSAMWGGAGADAWGGEADGDACWDMEATFTVT